MSKLPNDHPVCITCKDVLTEDIDWRIECCRCGKGYCTVRCYHSGWKQHVLDCVPEKKARKVVTPSYDAVYARLKRLYPTEWLTLNQMLALYTTMPIILSFITGDVEFVSQVESFKREAKRLASASVQ